MKKNWFVLLKKHCLITLICISGFMTSAHLFGQNSPFCINLLTKERYMPPVEKNFDINKIDYTPYIKVFLPEKDKSTGRAVVVCPGGGYGMIAFGHEGTSWAKYFNDLGIVTIVLKYRLPKGDYNIPIDDAETALKVVNDSVSVWNLNTDDIGIMGFSAGGHLASTIATHTMPPLKLGFQILFYPVITMDKSYTHIGSHNNLLGENASSQLEYLFSNEKQVTQDTPPAFIALATDDQVVPPANGIRYFEALIRNKIYASMHIYPTGNHGWGYSKKYKFNDAILYELTLWLDQINQKN